MMQRNEIEKIADSVLKQFSIKSSPYSHIKEICDHERIKIKKAKFSSSMDGAFSVIQKGKFIFYNPQMIEERQNFTKAHELGHYFLEHQLEAGNAIYCYNQSISENNQNSLPRIETEANYFATFFLMPKDMMLTEYYVITDILGITQSRPLYIDRQDCNFRNWTYISRHFKTRFGVSKEALRYRLEALGKIRYRA